MEMIFEDHCYSLEENNEWFQASTTNLKELFHQLLIDIQQTDNPTGQMNYMADELQFWLIQS